MSVSPVTSRPESRLHSSEPIAAIVIVVIALAITLYGPLESIGERAPLALLLVGSVALGALTAWVIRRRKPRR